MEKGIVSTPDERLIVEVPLDADWLTPNGFYIAGYYWGRKIRSPDDPDVQRQDPNFIRGVEDGYGDGMAKNERELQATAAQREAEATIMREQQAKIDALLDRSKKDRLARIKRDRALRRQSLGDTVKYDDDYRDEYGIPF